MNGALLFSWRSLRRNWHAGDLRVLMFGLVVAVASVTSISFFTDRVQRAMERLLPSEALRALCLAIELEILSQELDAEVTRNLPAGPVTVERYAEAYRKAGRRADRERQIELLNLIGGYLDHVVRKPVVGALVRMARGPAHAAGFGSLQEFLERGLRAFEAMHGAGEFLATLRARETQAMDRVFSGTADPFEFDARSDRKTPA